MKKLSLLVAALIAAPAFAVTTLTLSVESDGNSAVSAAAGATVDVQIVGVLSGDATDGLALFGTNLTNTGTAAIDLADQAGFLLTAPAGDVEQFDRNLGVTNPPGPVPGPTGFSGTDDGADGLLQIGGGQNTIGNSGPTLYPVGSVVTGVANSSAVLASGTITVPGGAADGETIVLELNTVFANTIDVGQSGPVYNVSAADTAVGGSLTITVGGGGCPGFLADPQAVCPQCDINGDSIVNVFDLNIIKATANFGLTVALADDECADVTNDGVINVFDLSECAATACFGQ
jgi:hypothetical protein